jgi:hypothetical protein
MSGHAKALDHAATFRARFTNPSRATTGSTFEHSTEPDEPSSKSPWLDSMEGADLVRCPNRKAFRAWARRAGIIAVHRGTRVLYTKRDVDAAPVKRQSARNGGAR